MLNATAQQDNAHQSGKLACYLCVRLKCIFLNSTVCGFRQDRFTLYFPDRYVHSDTISASPGSIQPYATN